MKHTALFDSAKIHQHQQLLAALDMYQLSWELIEKLILSNGGCSSDSNHPSLPQGIKISQDLQEAYEVGSSGEIMLENTNIPPLGPANSNFLLLQALPTAASGY